MSPLMSEGQSRRAWRRRVADYVVRQVDNAGFARFVGVNPEDRREMLKVAEILPDDIDITQVVGCYEHADFRRHGRVGVRPRGSCDCQL